MIDLTIDTEQVRAKLTGFIRAELAKAGFQNLLWDYQAVWIPPWRVTWQSKRLDLKMYWLCACPTAPRRRNHWSTRNW